MRFRLAGLTIVATLWGCPAAGPGAPSAGLPAPTPSASAALASPLPSASPVATGDAAATPAVTPAPKPAARVAVRLVREYDFKGVVALAVDPFQRQIHVVDGLDGSAVAARYGLKRFSQDGRFLASVDLHRSGERAPDAVNGYVIDRAGLPHFLYQDDEAVTLRRLYTATVLDRTDFPVYQVPRAGLATLRADGDVLTLGALSLDPDEKALKTRNKREIWLAQAEPGEQPLALVKVADPFTVVTQMAAGPGGTLYVAGALPGGRKLVQRLDASSQWTPLAGTEGQAPDRMVVSPGGAVWCFFFSTGNAAARWVRYGADGRSTGEGELKTAEGETLLRLSGVAFETETRLVAAGLLQQSGARTLTGLFEFDVEDDAK